MKIKTVTCHDVYNVGASLQAYALAAYLKKMGHQVEIIDYKPDYLSNHYPLWGVNNPAYDKPILGILYNLAKLPGRLKARYGKRKKNYDAFTKMYLPTTARRYTSNDDLKKSLPEADVYFAGSDQIWNCFFQNGRDPTFYLDFAPQNSIKASYAASFAQEEIPEEWKAVIKSRLDRLDYISVRESSGVKIVQELGIQNAEQVMDPVFLLDSSEWKSIEKVPDNIKPYVLLYDFDCNPEMVHFARELAEKNGWKLYSILPCRECDRCFVQEGPLTFLGVVDHAEFVVSNSFHATAFSLIFQKQFVVFDRKEKINTRMRNLVSAAGLQNRVWSASTVDLQEIDYEQVNEKLSEKIKASKWYIERVLSGEKQ